MLSDGNLFLLHRQVQSTWSMMIGLGLFLNSEKWVIFSCFAVDGSDCPTLSTEGIFWQEQNPSGSGSLMVGAISAVLFIHLCAAHFKLILQWIAVAVTSL